MNRTIHCEAGSSFMGLSVIHTHTLSRYLILARDCASKLCVCVGHHQNILVASFPLSNFKKCTKRISNGLKARMWRNGGLTWGVGDLDTTHLKHRLMCSLHAAADLARKTSSSTSCKSDPPLDVSTCHVPPQAKHSVSSLVLGVVSVDQLSHPSPHGIGRHPLRQYYPWQTRRLPNH